MAAQPARKRTALRLSLVVLVVLAAALAGCGGGGKTPTQTTVSDVVVIFSIAPPAGTVLTHGTAVTITGTVSYQLNSAASATMVMVVQDQSGHSLTGAQPMMTVANGKGQVVLADTVNIPSSGVSQVQVIFDLISQGPMGQDTAASITYAVN
jgi:hypothetical protein